jgi:hypothetical protein
MTPKQKAEELFYKFYNSRDKDGYCNGCELVYEHSREIAIICVDEILIVIENERVFESIEYWEEVKKEIEQL